LSGRLAYAALMGAVFAGVMACIGLTAPATAVPYAWNTVVQLLLGEAMAFLVNWVTGVERTVAIAVVGEPLLPIRANWLNTSAMLGVGQLAALFSTLFLGLPALQTMVSAIIIGVTPGGVAAQWTKAWQRSLGAVLGGGYAIVTMALLAFLPAFPLLLALVFLGMFIAAYYAKTSSKNSYVFLQMGLVMPMILIGAHDEIGSFDKALNRLVGVAVGLFVAEVVNLAWPQSDLAQAPQAAASAVANEDAQRR